MAYETFCLDIETANAKPTELERWMRLTWAPDPRWKADTIGSRFLEAFEKKKAKLALLDASPILCVTIKTEADLRCLHCMKAAAPELVDGALVEGFANERDMLKALRNLTQITCDAGTIVVGHNILSFDLPKLRHSFLRNGLGLPWLLVNREQPSYDTMREFGRSFSLERELFVSVKDLAEDLGLRHHKGLADGGAVPELHAAGNFQAIIAYGLLDVLLEYELFLRMTGQQPAIEPAGGEPDQAVDALSRPEPAPETMATVQTAEEPSTF